MVTRINPQEIFLLERFISLTYFKELRDTWAAMIRHLENCLDTFSRSLPANYRSRPLSEQPDIVWGERVLPNFRYSLQNLDKGLVFLSHDDVRGLNYAHGPINDFKGQREFWAEWMSPTDQTLYFSALNKATTMAGNICRTEGAYWNPLSLSTNADLRGPINPPAVWPTYHIDKNTSVRTGDPVIQSGIYMPDVDDSCPQFLCVEYKVAPKASVIIGYDERLNPTTGIKFGEEPIFEDRPCMWFLVERTPDAGQSPTHRPDTDELYRTVAGEVCPRTGFYFTPACPGSQKLFEKGEVMPDLDSAYGATIWQWASTQT